jgi:integrase
MARQVERLTAKAVATKKAAGYHADGAGLYLQISEAGTKSWIYRFTLNGRSREMGLGSLNAFGLAQARERAQAARQLLADGLDPIEVKRATLQARATDASKSITFEAAATSYIRSHRAGWRNSKHAAQWTSTLETYVHPLLGRLNVADIDTGLVMRILEPLWTAKPETATRVRGRIESVLNWATTRGYRNGDNPARWRGHLDNLLPARIKVRKVKHHAALPYGEIGAFMAQLKHDQGVAAGALQFAILTAGRTGEVIGAKWAEIDLDDGAVWVIPASRMKAEREHRVPLSSAAISVLNGLQRSGEYVFPGQKRGTPLSNMAMLELLKRMGRDDLTVHGFRSSFRDWAAECTGYPREVIEMALAHTVSDKTEAAYFRADLFDKRRRLLADWAKHCSTVKADAKVIAPKK